MKSSVHIAAGVSPWRIYQQKDGFAEITVSGTRVRSGNPGDGAYLRVVSENDNSAVTEWARASETENNGVVSFSIKLKVPAGGLYRVESCRTGSIRGINWAVWGDCIHHIGVGNLFVIAGQSNAAGYGKTPAEDAPEPGVSLFRNDRTWDIAAHPLNDSTGAGENANCDASNTGTSPYLTFGKRMKAALGCPVGLIQTSLGGSAIALWQKGQPLFENMLEAVSEATGSDNRVAGILWYQGCTDANEKGASVYASEFSDFVSACRTELHDDVLPFYTVQLNKLTDGSGSADIGWSKLRDIQRRAAREIPGVYITPSLDLGLCDGIHNSSASNVVLGERLAKLALCAVYGRKDIKGKVPDAESVTYDGKNIVLRLSDVSSYIISPAGDKLPFVITDAEGEVPAEKMYVDGRGFTIRPARELAGEAYLSFAPGENPVSQLPTDASSGLPVLAFIEEIRILPKTNC